MVSTLHLILLAVWCGVVATEGVLELYPYRRPDMHQYSIRFHYWIDLLVELPLIIGVLATGTVLVVVTWPATALQVVKICCGLVAVSANLACIVIVLRRKRKLDAKAPDAVLWRSTRRIILCAAAGLPFATAAAGLGFWLGYHRLLELIG